MKAISKETFNGVLKGMDIADISRATIRQCVNATQELERISGEKYVHLEFGVPGIKASQSILLPEASLNSNGTPPPSSRRS